VYENIRTLNVEKH